MIDTPVLRQLARLGSLEEVIARQVPGGFVVIVRNGIEEEALLAQRGGPRTFRHLDTLCSFLAQVGVLRFTVEAGNFGTQNALRI